MFYVEESHASFSDIQSLWIYLHRQPECDTLSPDIGLISSHQTRIRVRPDNDVMASEGALLPAKVDPPSLGAQCHWTELLMSGSSIAKTLNTIASRSRIPMSTPEPVSSAVPLDTTHMNHPPLTLYVLHPSC